MKKENTAVKSDKTASRRHGAQLLGEFLKGSRLLFVAAVVGSIASTFFGTLTPQVLRLSVDVISGATEHTLPYGLDALVAPLLTGDTVRVLTLLALCTLACALLMGVGNYLYKICTARGAEKFAHKLRGRLFSHIQRLPMTWHSENQTGDIIQRCTQDTEVIRSFIANQLTEVFRIVFYIGISMYMMLSMNVTLSLIALAFVPVVVTYSYVFYRKIAARFLAADEAEGDLTACVQENLTGMRVVRAFGQEKAELARFDRKNAHWSELWVHLGRVLSLFWGTGDFFTGMQIAVITVAGCIFTVRGDITLGTFVAFINYNAMLVWPIRGLGRILSEMSKSGVSFDRLGYILDAGEEDYDDGVTAPFPGGDIVFDNVTFGYDGRNVLNGTSFTVPAGKTVAILGSTGSGKSTVVQLLTRLYELGEGGGKITVGGVNIRDIPLHTLRRSIGLINQEPFLFSRTVGENIAACRPGATLEEIRAAARAAYIDREIMSFEKGYDTPVGERGVTLSGGQKQRVAIARTLLAQTPVVIFDDSLSAVDAQTDSDIRASLSENTSGRSVIIISHRVTTLMTADEIVVLENGRVTGRGTHEELISREGLYKSIYDIQMRASDKALAEGGRA